MYDQTQGSGALFFLHQITSSAGGGGLPLLIPILKNTNHKLQLQSSSTQLVNCVLGGGGGEVRGVVALCFTSIRTSTSCKSSSFD